MRPDLMALVGQRVTVTHHGPATTSAWTGKLVALADHPTLILDLDDGRRMVLQQYRCKVTRADDIPPEQTDWDSQIANGGHLLKDFQDVKRALREDRLIARLDTMLANLRQHIDERAAELAVPHIEQARAEVAEAQEERDHWRERFTDLQREHQRQHKVVERRAVRAETAIARALGTMRANTLPPPAHPTDYQRGYQACADHVTTALNGATDQQEADRADT